MVIIMAGGAGIQRQMVQGGTRDIQESALSQGAAHHSVSEDRSNHRRGKTSKHIKNIFWWYQTQSRQWDKPISGSQCPMMDGFMHNHLCRYQPQFRLSCSLSFRIGGCCINCCTFWTAKFVIVVTNSNSITMAQTSAVIVNLGKTCHLQFMATILHLWTNNQHFNLWQK